MNEEKARHTIEERLAGDGSEAAAWRLTEKLFGEILPLLDIYDLEVDNYNYLLDKSETKEALIQGLRELSPLVDEALDVAENMSDEEFGRFREELRKMRASIDSDLSSKRFRVLAFPSGFMEALHISETHRVTLGAALVRMAETKSRS